MNEVTVSQPGGTGALMQLIQRMATDEKFDVAKLEALLAVKEKWEAGEAKKAYDTAFAAFKTDAVKIFKNRVISDGPLRGKMYADLAAVVDALTPPLSARGFSASWAIFDEKDWIAVECILTHVEGHSERRRMSGPPDTGGAKNPIQARASALNYLERYTFLAVTGMAAAEADDDGNGGPDKEGPPETDPWTPEAEAAAALAAKGGHASLKTWWQSQTIEFREAARNTSKYADFVAASQQ